MKNLRWIASSAILVIAISIYAKPTEGNDGITFSDEDWASVLKEAKSNEKLIFLDIYASWCGPCKKLKANTFPNEEVGQYFNTHFVSKAVDGEKGEGIELARKYKIKGYPSLIFLNSKGELIALTTGYRSPEEFLELGKKMVDK